MATINGVHCTLIGILCECKCIFGESLHLYFVFVCLFVWTQCNQLVSIQVISVPVDDRDTAEFLSRHDGQLDFWNNVIIGKSTHILIEPSQTGFLDALTSAGIGFEVMIDDVDAYAERSMARVHQKRLESKNNNDKQAGFDFGIYHTIEEINGFIDYVNETYPNTFIDKMGFSYEGRWVRILKICPTGRCESNIPTMYIQCSKYTYCTTVDTVYNIHGFTLHGNEQNVQIFIPKNIIKKNCYKIGLKLTQTIS